MKSIFVLSFLFLIISCAKTDEQLIDAAKQEALFHLTHGDCQDAKDALDTVDYQTDDATYISLYASVYGCKAGYSELSTVLDNLSSLNATSADLFKTLASFSSSQVETAADSTAYTNIMLAINEILKAGGGTQPSAVTRISSFGAREAGDLNIQALLLITIEMGKYFGYYGNAGTDGTKGGGAGSTACLAELTDGTARGHLDTYNGTDSCTAALNSTTTNSVIQNSDSDYVRKLCEGIILFNNFQDILANLSFSTNSSELGALVDVGAVLNTIETTAAALEPAIADYKDVTSQTVCETTAVTKGNELQRYFAMIIENFHN